MKKLVFILLSIFVISSFAQREVAKREDLQKFFKTKTLVVLEPNPMSSYNFYIKDAIKREWNITPYDFIEASEYEKMRKDPQYSFITLDDVYFAKDKSKAKYTFICLSLGGNYHSTSDMPQLATFPLSYRGVEEQYYAYKLGPIIHFIQNHVKLTNDIPTLKPVNIINYYNREAPSMKDKTLYLMPSDLSKDINTEAKFKKIYPYNFKFVTQEELEEIIKNQTKDAVFFHKVGPMETMPKGRVYKIFMGAEDGKIYYFGYHMISKKKPDRLLDRDIRILTKEKKN